jgi:hypothetical protein
METMVAVTVFLLSIVTVVGAYPVSVRASRLAHGHLMASTLAEKEIEFSRAMDYDAVETREQTYNLVLEAQGAPCNLTFQTHMEVSEVREGLKRLKLTVSWSGLDSQTRRNEMETYVARLTP